MLHIKKQRSLPWCRKRQIKSQGNQDKLVFRYSLLYQDAMPEEPERQSYCPQQFFCATLSCQQDRLLCRLKLHWTVWWYCGQTWMDLQVLRYRDSRLPPQFFCLKHRCIRNISVIRDGSSGKVGFRLLFLSIQPIWRISLCLELLRWCNTHPHRRNA